MKTAQRVFLLSALLGLASLPGAARAGLDLSNQTEIPVAALDLDHDGRIHRHEMARYMFYYFDHDGNETLTNGEYGRKRPLALVPYEGTEVSIIDLDNDGQDDGVAYDTATFAARTVIGEIDAAATEITAKIFLGTSFLKMDKDKSGGVELDEWLKAYEKHAVIQPNQPPKAADNDGYN
jgi:hypothetical protein